MACWQTVLIILGSAAAGVATVYIWIMFLNRKW